MVTSKRYLSQRGITLLEVMISVAIASIALVSFISLVLSSLEMEDYARKVTEATLIADDRLKEVERAGFPELGEAEGMVDENDPSGFTFRQVVSETPIEDVRLIELEVFWENRKHSVDLSAYMVKK